MMVSLNSILPPNRWCTPILVLLIGALAGCSNSELKPFTSDGCTLFPDSSDITGKDWCSCCFEHDLAYWRGGTEKEREAADAKLRDCVFEKTQDEALAKLMYEGVQFGGSPYFYNWYRWGYGWGYDRKYQELTATEAALAEQLERDYLRSAEARWCEQAR